MQKGKVSSKFDFSVTKFPGEMDLMFAFWRHQKLEMTIKQTGASSRLEDLSYCGEFKAEVSIWRMEVLNPKEKTFRFSGFASLCLPNEGWVGTYNSLDFVCEVNILTRKGGCSLWR